MTYVMSDLHGRYRQYLEILDQIGFSDEDELYVVGDVVDRGPQPVEILLDMSLRPNVFPILGNHEYMARSLLSRLCVEITEGNAAENAESHLSAEDLSALAGWLTDGGQTTLEGFRKLTLDQREGILAYMEESAPYEELIVGENRFILVHGGLADFDPHRPLDDYDLCTLVTEHTDYTRTYFPDRYLVTGHVPTGLIEPGYGGRILRKNNHIALDCGNGWGGTLGCLRLEDMAEFYVE